MLQKCVDFKLFPLNFYSESIHCCVVLLCQSIIYLIWHDIAEDWDFNYIINWIIGLLPHVFSLCNPPVDVWKYM